MSVTPFVAGLAKVAAEKARLELERRRLFQSETNQTTVWLVGLASTLLALTVASPDRVRNVVGTAYATVAILLLVTVISGAVVRVGAVWISYFSEVQLSELRYAMDGLATKLAQPIQSDLKLSMNWSVEEIVAKFKSHFDSDYSFLLEHNTPIDRCRKMYQETYERHIELERDLVSLFGMALAAFEGWTDLERQNWEMEHRARAAGEFPHSESAAETKVTVALAAAGLATKWLYRARIASDVTFTISAAAFVAAMFLVARGLYVTS